MDDLPIPAPLPAPTCACDDRATARGGVVCACPIGAGVLGTGVADIAADSLALAVEAEKTDADIIILCGVHFMAETAKLMNPNKKVLLPDMGAGCSLASSITGKDVRMLKEKYPGIPVVSYVNTSAEVKAESDVCCTSANAVKVVESLGVDKVIFLPCLLYTSPSPRDS